jgi:arylsulfatase A-like enzyme
VNRRDFLQSAAAAGAGRLLAAPAKPNIVYVLADDLGWGDLRCYNKESQIPTPYYDRFAAQGVRFTDMHSPSSVCTPTRYGIMTGRYCWRSRLKNGVLNGYSSNLIENGRMTVASMLKQQGYHTGVVGKWHLGLGEKEPADFSKPLKPSPLDHGFDYFFGIPASLDMAPYLYVENDRAVEQPTLHTPGRNEPRGVFWREGPIAPSLKMEEVLPTLARQAIGYLRERARKPEQPFFLYLPLTGPHTPWVPMRPFQGKSKAGIYGDFVTQVDDVVGQVLRALDDGKQAANTLVVLTSDNGAHWTPQDKALFPHRANANWRGQKADIWDAGHRIPFLARWPGRSKAGHVSDQLGCLTDLMATAAEVTGAALPADSAEDSFSWLNCLQGKTGTRNSVVHHSSQGMFSIREGDWKLALGLGSGGFSEPRTASPKPGAPPSQLYNLRQDPREERNVYLDNTQTVKRLETLLTEIRNSGRSRPA